MQNNKDNIRWVCSQYGSRERYTIPYFLHQQRKLDVLFTDIWLKQNTFLKLFNISSSRYHNKIPNLLIRNFNWLLLIKKFGFFNSEQIFDKLVSANLPEIEKQEKKIFFTYSYGSLEKIKQAKKLGYKIVYSQINPGPQESEIIKDIYNEYPKFKKYYNEPDLNYWKKWREEINLVDIIIVNSEWSKKLLIKEGISEKKIKIIGLHYKKNIQRKKDISDNRKNNIRVLFLGSISIRKGFHLLKESFAKLIDKPIELHVVGRLNGPPELIQNLSKNIILHKEVSPNKVCDFYNKSDIFILPTYSDGFALTQLEAFNYGVPIITTPYCAKIVNHNKNGIILEENNVNNITKALLYFINNPNKISLMSKNIKLSNEYSQNTITSKLLNIEKILF